MSRMIFVNLAVENLKRSVDFFTTLGFTFNAQFTSEDTTCMIINDQAMVMLLEKPRFQGFTKKIPVDTTTHVEAFMALSCSSREEVDHLVQTAVANGGSHAMPPQDHGFMYGWSFYCPDGHTWEVVWMDPAAVQG
ncbi:MAG TPA: VOC family protein [Myxococcota bacterium]